MRTHVWLCSISVAIVANFATSQENPLVEIPGQFGPRVGVFSGYGPGFGIARGVGYGYGLSPRFTPMPDWRYSYGPRISAGFGLGYFSPIGLGPQFSYGPQYGYLGRSYGNGFGWYYPAAFGSFWTNGLSLYGPPVPTFAPVPGSFGGSDAHRFYYLQSYYSLDWDSFRYKSKMPYGWEPTAKWAEACRTCARIVPAPTPANKGRLTIRTPDSTAEVWIGTTKMTGFGAERRFETPALEPGQAQEYEIIARWIVDGQSVAKSRKVTLKAGESLSLDLGSDE